ncbi:MAG: hypothetical protein ACLQNE_15410 [Thermoguttaceae bacterium]
MKRLLALVAVLVPLSLFAAGCGGSGASDKASLEKAQQKNMEDQQKIFKEMGQKKQIPIPGRAAKP